MDDRLEKALEHANYMSSLARQKDALKAKFANDLIFAHNGGLFTITRELLTYLEAEIAANNLDIIVIDDKTTPIRIIDAKTVHAAMRSQFNEALNDYYHEFEKLRKARTVKALTGI